MYLLEKRCNYDIRNIPANLRHLCKSEAELGAGPRCSLQGAIWVDDGGWELDQSVSEWTDSDS